MNAFFRLRCVSEWQDVWIWIHHRLTQRKSISSFSIHQTDVPSSRNQTEKLNGSKKITAFGYAWARLHSDELWQLSEVFSSSLFISSMWNVFEVSATSIVSYCLFVFRKTWRKLMVLCNISLTCRIIYSPRSMHTNDEIRTAEKKPFASHHNRSFHRKPNHLWWVFPLFASAIKFRHRTDFFSLFTANK